MSNETNHDSPQRVKKPTQWCDVPGVVSISAAPILAPASNHTGFIGMRLPRQEVCGVKGKTKNTARISTSGRSPRRQHALLAKRRTPKNSLFDTSESETSDTEGIDDTSVMSTKSMGGVSKGAVGYSPLVPRKQCASPYKSTLRACSEIAAGRRSVELARKLTHNASINLQLAEQHLEDAENGVTDAHKSVKRFKFQLSQAKIILKGEKINLANLEKKHSVINVESDCETNV